MPESQAIGLARLDGRIQVLTQQLHQVETEASKAQQSVDAAHHRLDAVSFDLRNMWEADLSEIKSDIKEIRGGLNRLEVWRGEITGRMAVFAGIGAIVSGIISGGAVLILSRLTEPSTVVQAAIEFIAKAWL